MKERTFKNALVSVSDKTGLVDFLRPLAEAGMRVVSSGGTAKHLVSEGIDVVAVNEQTGFPEVMDGRVKTLHPNIHMPLLARQEVAGDTELLKQSGLEPFDLVIVNLYPFAQALKKGLAEEELIEFIDIGGPTLLRAAAKNHQRITVICDPADYQWVAEKDEVTLPDRQKLAAKVFSHVSTYDGVIAHQLSAGEMALSVNGESVAELRYGENPQQKSLWKSSGAVKSGLHEAEILQGKPLSYNNLLDIDAAVLALQEFDQNCAVAVKHNNPCGIAQSSERGIAEVVEMALKADPVSVFGGIVAVNRALDSQVAEKLSGLFLECVIAPEVESEALEVFRKKKNLRILSWPQMMESRDSWRLKSVLGGVLVQEMDQVQGWSEDWQVHGASPTNAIKQALGLAWRACAHLKSNAIAIAGADHTVGMGMGQVNRVDAVEQAIARWQKHHPQTKAEELVLASDAFFPFADSIEFIANAGIKWVIQPGGSIRDDEVFAAAKERGVNIVISGRRHFRH